MTAAPMHDWVPIRIYSRDGRGMVDWCHMGGERFTDPFFADTVERRLGDPFALLFRHQTTLDELVEIERSDPGVPPAGFIFHVSRCGSTLVSRMLAGFAENVVLSEPPPIDALLHARLLSPGVDDANWATWLRALVGAMARPRQAAERRCFVKLDAWHALALPLFRRAFPEVPWVFLHRHPVEVMVSHQRQTGAQMVPGPYPPQLFGIATAELPAMPAEEYGARVLAAICDAALRHLGDGGLAVAYDELPEAAWTSIATHFGLRLDADAVAAMRGSGRQDAKRPGHTYSDDRDAKRRAASAATRDAAERFAVQSWSRLEAMRLGALAGTG